MNTTASLTDALTSLLDEAFTNLRARRGAETLRLLQKPFCDIFLAAKVAGCEHAVMSAAKSHPLSAIARQDPFTERCRAKPRGYAGDAVMLDYVYSREAPDETSDVGRHWFDFTTVSSSAMSVRYRRTLLHACINETVVQTHNYRILSIASGHCRELENSLVLNDQFAGTFVAFDQDAQSCALVDAEYARAAGGRIHVVNRGVRALLDVADPLREQQFDFVYSAGLYDYLNDRTACALTDALVGMVKPGGKLLVANFVPQTATRGYMEAYMEWDLIYRTPEQLAATFGAHAPAVQTQIDPHGNVVYATLLK
jgi:extracellular factor (EF) 3-hydroxypalmitic acid methyl ester biosynthesis protein